MEKNSFQKEIAQLEQINKEQKMIIQILCDAYYSSDRENYDYNRIFNLISKSSLKMIYHSPKKDTQTTNNNDLERIKELEKLIIQQDQEYAKLEQKLIEYNAKAKEYEDEMAQNEREKAQIIANFQHSSTSNGSNVSNHFKELEKKAQELTEECNKARARNNDAQSLYGEIQQQLIQSQNQVKMLEKQVENSKSQLLASANQDEDLLRQISEQDKLIEDLTTELTEANNKIAKLKRENQSIRDQLMAHDDDDSEEV